MKEMSEQTMEKQFLLSLAEDAEKLLAKSLEECKVDESATMKIWIQFPQFLDSLHRYKYLVQKKWKLRELSDNLINALKLGKDNYRALLFNERGAPFHHNLQLLSEVKCEEIVEEGDSVFAIVIRADNDSPEYPDLSANDGPLQIFIKYDGKTYTISLDLENTTVLQLK